MKASIGIDTKNRQAVVDELSKILADEFVLYTKTLNAHWNIEGPDFYDKHKFFEGQYEQLQTVVDNVAERIRILGHYAPGSLKSFLSLTQLTEAVSEKNDSKGFIKELLEDHDSIIIKLRGNIDHFADDLNDSGSSDFITSLTEQHEKMAWFLRSHL